MATSFSPRLGLTGWLVFPLVPVILEDFYYQTQFESFLDRGVGSRSRDWGWCTWIIMLGPLLGYGFLAGATVDIPDDLGPSVARLAPASVAAVGLGGDRTLVRVPLLVRSCISRSHPWCS